MENMENKTVLENTEKLKLFEFEFSKIHNPKFKQFAEDVLVKLVPDYFFEVAASSTGKYHPTYALGHQGLVRHTQAATRIAIGLFQIMDMTPDTEDAVIVALAFHDAFKHGLKMQKYTISEHPVVASQQIKEFAEEYEDIEIVCFANTVAELILTHMGQWNIDRQTRKPFAPRPQNSVQNFVHMCDYLASRKYLEFIFGEKI